MTAKKLREMSVEELVGKEEDLRSSIFKIRFRAVLGSEGEAVKIKSLRKDIARIKTVLRARDLYGK